MTDLRLEGLLSMERMTRSATDPKLSMARRAFLDWHSGSLADCIGRLIDWDEVLVERMRPSQHERQPAGAFRGGDVCVLVDLVGVSDAMLTPRYG